MSLSWALLAGGGVLVIGVVSVGVGVGAVVFRVLLF